MWIKAVPIKTSNRKPVRTKEIFSIRLLIVISYMKKKPGTIIDPIKWKNVWIMICDLC